MGTVIACVDRKLLHELLGVPYNLRITDVVPIWEYWEGWRLTMDTVGFRLEHPDLPSAPVGESTPTGTLKYEGPVGITHELKGWKQDGTGKFYPLKGTKPRTAHQETQEGKPLKEFPTGAVREDKKGKGRYDLISPKAMQALALTLQEGAAKYGDRNWEKGMPLTSLLDSVLRHIFQALDGRSDEDHIGHAFWGLMAFLHTRARVREGTLPASLDDMRRGDWELTEKFNGEPSHE